MKYEKGKRNGRTKVSFLHLDLGIGGAERLVVDAATQCQELGYQVQIYTTHHDITHCFPETLEKDKRASFVHVFGDWLPRYIDVGMLTGSGIGSGREEWGSNSNSNRRFVALCGITRMLYLATVFIFNHIFTLHDEAAECDAHIVFLDGLSVPIPLLAMFGFPVLFYCHFPDRYLSPINLEKREISGIVPWCKRCYRDVVDILEDISMAQAVIVAVNSEFTASVCRESFSFLRNKEQESKLVTIYPAVSCSTTDINSDRDEHGDVSLLGYCNDYDHVFVSLNRYERKKKLELAINAFKIFIENYNQKETLGRMLLVVSGGYDEVVEENVSYYKELAALVQSLNLNDVIVFRRSISNEERIALMKRATALLYTPDREHFGIVPIEAMSLGTAVIAVASGGPLETIKDGVTGFLVKQEPHEFAAAMYKIASKDNKCNEYMGKAGKERVKALFSTDALGAKLESTIDQIIKTQGKPGYIFLTAWIVILIMFGQGIGYTFIRIGKVLGY